MNRHRSLFGALFVALLLVVPPMAVSAADDTTAPYIVVFRGQTDVDGETAGLQRQFGFTERFRYTHALRGFAARLTSAQAAAIARLSFVAGVAHDGTVQAIGTAPMAAGDSAPPGVRRVGGANATVVHTAAGPNVAVIDTGVNFNHPDLNAVSGKNCITSGADALDDNGHGTHVSGTIGARNNGSGVVGVAPGTKIYAVKVLNSQGSGSWSQIICGLDWVTANASSLNIKVANMSLGGSGSNSANCGNSQWGVLDPLHLAICNTTNAGVTIVVAAGNSNANESGFVPAAFPETLSVTAVADTDGVGGKLGPVPCRAGEQDDTYATFSNFAASGDTTQINHTIAGPGVCVLSTTMDLGYQGNWSGTSMATPHVVGVTALCLSPGGACVGMTPANTIQKVRQLAADHAAAVPTDYFTGDPTHAVSGRYYGNMAWIGNDLGPVAPTVPGAPTLNSATAGNGQVTLGWSAPSSNGGANVDGYYVYQDNVKVGSLIAGTSTTITGLTNATQYSFTVTAHNSVGEGAKSNARTATPSAGPTVPGAPTLNSATAGNGQVTLGWSAPSSNGGANVDGYYVYRNGSQTNGGALVSGTSFTDTGLTNGTSYSFTISAHNSVGEGAQSNARSATPAAAASVPGAPSLTAATNPRTCFLGIFCSGGGQRLTWTAPASNGSAITGYRVFRSTTSTVTTTGTPLTTTTSTTYTDTARTVKYFYAVVAVNAVGPGPASNVASATPG